MLEAMSSGLPVIIADKNESAVVQHGITGFRAQVDNRKEFIEYGPVRVSCILSLSKLLLSSLIFAHIYNQNPKKCAHRYVF